MRSLSLRFFGYGKEQYYPAQRRSVSSVFSSPHNIRGVAIDYRTPNLVRKSGVKHTTLTKIESNVVIKPSVQTVAKIAKVLGVPMEDLVK